jgi:branched-subunit amino acid aminotransferase/4-amino-4-deoxychorismate lyase
VDRVLLEAELAEFATRTIAPDCGVRLMVTRGGQRVWREEPLPTPPPGLRLLPVEHRVTPLLVGAKTLSYAANMHAKRLAAGAGCDDALLVEAGRGVILEGPTTAFGWLEGDALVFPPLDLGVLDSITRRLAAEAVPVRERAATLADLAGAEGALSLSTLHEAQPVAEVAGAARFDPTAARVLEVRAAIRDVIAARVEEVAAPA